MKIKIYIVEWEDMLHPFYVPVVLEDRQEKFVKPNEEVLKILKEKYPYSSCPSWLNEGDYVKGGRSKIDKKFNLPKGNRWLIVGGTLAGKIIDIIN